MDSDGLGCSLPLSEVQDGSRTRDASRPLAAGGRQGWRGRGGWGRLATSGEIILLQYKRTHSLININIFDLDMSSMFSAKVKKSNYLRDGDG